MKKYLLFFALVIFFQHVNAQQPALNNYPDPFIGTDQNAATDVVQLQNSDLLATAAIHGYPALMRTDLNGVNKWSKLLYSTGIYWGLDELINYDPATVYILGHSYSPQYCALVIKADTAGNIKWTKKIAHGNKLLPVTMIKTYDNKFLILTADTANTNELVKLDTSGNVVWSKRYYSTYTPAPQGATSYGGYPHNGAGNIVELSDHSITIATTTLQHFGWDTTYGYNSATIIKADSNGNVLWVKKIQPPQPVLTFPAFAYWISGPELTSAGDLFHTSDNCYIVGMAGNYTLKLDSNGNAIPGNCLYDTRQLTIISEYPQGHLNIVENGGMCCGDVVSPYNPVLYQTDINFNAIVGKIQNPAQTSNSLSQPYYVTGHVRQLADRRIVLTGNYNEYDPYYKGAIILITDSAGNQGCSSQNYPHNLSLDTQAHTFPGTINTDTGITIQSITVNDSLQPLVHCSCDTMLTASFSISISGLTVSLYNSSQNAQKFLWTFGDGTTDSTTLNPVHIYTGSLPQYIYLTVFNKCGSKQFSYKVQPTVSVGSAPSCNRSCNGIAIARVTGGTPPYTYHWNTSPVQTTDTAINLCPGTYQVYVTDSFNITSVTAHTTVIGDTIDVSITHTNISCDSLTAMATATASSVVGSFSYKWNSAPAIYTATVSGLAAGVNMVNIQDAYGCSIADTVVITQSAKPQVVNNVTNPSCFGSGNGWVTTITTSGTPPYTYMWDNDTSLKTADLYNLSAGTHILAIRDSSHCTRLDTVTLSQPAPLSITLTKQDLSCYNSNDGSITAVASGGQQPYYYSWNTTPVQISTSINTLPAGTYILALTDVHNCVANDTVALTQPSVLTDSTRTLNDLCYGQHTGVAIVYPYGGTMPYNIGWNSTLPLNGDTTNNLAAGTYPFVITDAHHCAFADTIRITQPLALTITMSGTNNTYNCNGTAIATVTGGTVPYQFYWSNNDTTQTIIGLCGGIYTVTVTDSNYCSVTDSITVTTTGISNTTIAADLTIVPNPFNEFVIVQLTNAHTGPTSTIVTNIVGATVYQATDNSTSLLRINTDAWTPGLYFIHVSYGEGHVIVRKVVKE